MAAGDGDVAVVFPDGSRLDFPFPETPVALWNINPYCNLECGYCYGSFGGASFKAAGRRPPSLAGRHLTRAARRLRERGVARVYLGGGEPLLRPDIVDVVSALRSHGIEVMVTTNLTVLPAEILELVENGGITRLSVSLDSLDPAYNDRVRQGTRRVLANIDRLLAAGGPGAAELGLYCVVTSANISDAHRLVAWAVDHHFDYLSLQPVALPTTHPLHDELTLHATHLPQLRPLFDDLRAARLHLQTSGEVFLTLWERLLATRATAVVSPCPAGRYLLYVSETGRVWRCPAYEIVTRELALFDVQDVRASLAPQDAETACSSCSYLSFDCLCMWELMYPQPSTRQPTGATGHGPRRTRSGPKGRGGGGTRVGSTSDAG